MNKRIETDSMGEVLVDSDKYWGAQTERSRSNFIIGIERFRFTRAIIRAFGTLKHAAACANRDLAELPVNIANYIIQAATEVRDGTLDEHFPLVVFQTGSGTQSNMNANEVIANRAAELAGHPRGSKFIHPNDHVNCGQSSNDTFPTAMYIAVAEELDYTLLPIAYKLLNTLTHKSSDFASIVKTARTHLQDATPITLGQEISAWAGQLQHAIANLQYHSQFVLQLAIGGTAVGTGLNAHPKFGDLAAAYIAEYTKLRFISAPNKFTALSSHDALVNISAALRTLAGALLKIANDIRLLASGPRCGIGEILIPANEPGSSIMPGKINPTQCEALTMVCIQVFGNDAAVAFAGSQGTLQLNVYKPVMVHNVLESIQLLSDAILMFNTHCATGIEPNMPIINRNLTNNLMLVTALNKYIGYDKAAKIAKIAHESGDTLQETAVQLGYLTAQEYDLWVQPLAMTSNQ